MEPDGLFQNDGRIFVTQAGGKGWMNISSGLDGSSVVGIYPDPGPRQPCGLRRHSHRRLLQRRHDRPGGVRPDGLDQHHQQPQLDPVQPVRNANYQQSVLAQFLGQNGSTTNSDVFTAQYGGFTSIVAD